MESSSAVIARINEHLEASAGRLGLPAGLDEAVRYALLGGGKRLRPLLAWRACEALGADPVRSLDAGAAVEFVHAFSLVHDDLPAMDNDDMRRGRPTLHIHVGEAGAILAGDALLGAAFLLFESYGAALQARLTRELSRGTLAMIGGQYYDTLGGLPAGLSDDQKLELIHRNKTGALITAACRMGAWCAVDAGAAEASVEAITKYAAAIGLMFQVVDDLLDVEQPAESTGKRTGKDAAHGKLTYPGLLGVARSRAFVRELELGAAEAVRPLGREASALVELAGAMARRTT